ncbi:MAG: FkbM family methyltransferase [Lachnospiraceae bacterium]
MKYTTVTNFEKIRQKYSCVIGWGTGPLFQMNYNPQLLNLDAIIDGTGKMVGQKICGIKVKDESYLSHIEGKTLIILFAIYENEIIDQIKKYQKDIDLIVYALLETGNCVYNPRINGKCGEDYILVTMLRQLHLTTVQYLEIGVCHPVLRNNTYLLSEMFSTFKNYRGVLVEANPTCWELIEEYRPNDLLIKCGVNVEDGKILPFYMFPHLLGHSTFDKEIARDKMEEGYECQEIEILTRNINSLLENYFDNVPDLLALDVEGLDYDVLSSWDDKKYPIKIVLTEVTECGEKNIDDLMIRKGYRCYATTMENAIWIREDIEVFV